MALKVIQSIEEAFDKICDSPNSYPVCFDIDVPANNIRQIIVHNTFKVIYRVAKDKLEIIEIFHGRRNPELIRNVND